MHNYGFNKEKAIALYQYQVFLSSNLLKPLRPHPVRGREDHSCTGTFHLVHMQLSDSIHQPLQLYKELLLQQEDLKKDHNYKSQHCRNTCTFSKLIKYSWQFLYIMHKFFLYLHLDTCIMQSMETTLLLQAINEQSRESTMKTFKTHLMLLPPMRAMGARVAPIIELKSANAPILAGTVSGV